MMPPNPPSPSPTRPAARAEPAEFIVRVTATDIRKGKRGRMGSCALALAISRALGWQVWVRDETFQGGGVKGRLSHDGQAFRYDFDQSKHDVSPRSFCCNYWSVSHAK